jgi:GntR family transcriptional regulator
MRPPTVLDRGPRGGDRRDGRAVDSTGRSRHHHVIMTNLLTHPPHGTAVARDRHLAVPLYVQLREALRTQIEEQGLRPGDRLPTETELEERYGVSRSTIRQAVGELETEGLLRRVQGKGTFVTAPKIQHLPVLTSFSELLRSQGHHPSHRLLRSTIVAAGPQIAHDLELAEDLPGRHLERLLVADDQPVGVSRTWLPLAVLGDHDRHIDRGVHEGGSLYQLLADSSPTLVPHRGTETIQPTLAGSEESRLLGCDPGTPLLEIRRCTWTATDLPLERTQLVFVPGRYEYRVELRRPSTTGSQP